MNIIRVSDADASGDIPGEHVDENEIFCRLGKLFPYFSKVW
ncbi:hypothetical protein RSJ42_04975 [Methanosarcina hadiensis]